MRWKFPRVTRVGQRNRPHVPWGWDADLAKSRVHFLGYSLQFTVPVFHLGQKNRPHDPCPWAKGTVPVTHGPKEPSPCPTSQERLNDIFARRFIDEWTQVY